MKLTNILQSLNAIANDRLAHVYLSAMYLIVMGYLLYWQRRPSLSISKSASTRVDAIGIEESATAFEKVVDLSYVARSLMFQSQLEITAILLLLPMGVLIALTCAALYYRWKVQLVIFICAYFSFLSWANNYLADGESELMTGSFQLYLSESSYCFRAGLPD
ncbi:MAG: hypothetical protein P1V29_08615 [Gammaproteobacteria bacterium]|nr:hypothetical protein [Gammaproteobacteria bacterium]